MKNYLKSCNLIQQKTVRGTGNVFQIMLIQVFKSKKWLNWKMNRVFLFSQLCRKSCLITFLNVFVENSTFRKHSSLKNLFSRARVWFWTRFSRGFLKRDTTRHMALLSAIMWFSPIFPFCTTIFLECIF